VLHCRLGGNNVDFSKLKAEIQSEIDKWQKVLTVLDGGRTEKKRTMSAAARKRISAAQKARWARWAKARKTSKAA
jgi:hypothetical protein